MRALVAAVAIALLACGASAQVEMQSTPYLMHPLTQAAAVAPAVVPGVVRPAPRDNDLPRARWENKRDGDLWTRVVLSAVETHGEKLLDVVPQDIEEWCPAYAENDREERAAFWAALLSTLARYESTWDSRAVGGGGLWYGLLQIYPQTAEFRNCRVQSGEGLKHGPSNLNCAVRIMSVTVPRDRAIAVEASRWKGVAADWGPIRTDWMRKDMQRYTRSQTYCRSLAEVRPKGRP